MPGSGSTGARHLHTNFWPRLSNNNNSCACAACSTDFCFCFLVSSPFVSPPLYAVLSASSRNEISCQRFIDLGKSRIKSTNSHTLNHTLKSHFKGYFAVCFHYVFTFYARTDMHKHARCNYKRCRLISLSVGKFAFNSYQSEIYLPQFSDDFELIFLRYC